MSPNKKRLNTNNVARFKRSASNLDNKLHGIARISRERCFQLRSGRTKNEDLAYVDSELTLNAEDCLTQYRLGRMRIDRQGSWNLHIKNIHDKVRLLTIAGALIAAELDRIKELHDIDKRIDLHMNRNKP